MKQRMELQDGYISSLQQRQDNHNYVKISSNPNDPITNLNRLEEDLNGEYVLFSDVIKAVSILFSAKNS